MEASVLNKANHSVSGNHIDSFATISALPAGVKLKEYRITETIGEGGFGIVYAARDTLLQRNVAIKEYMPATIACRNASPNIDIRSPRHQKAFEAGLQGFIDEARLLAQFKHPALVEILRFWEANNTAYMVMPHYSGDTLRNLFRKDPSLRTETQLKRIIGPILDAVELLHNNNVYHRDIAPDNIVLQEKGEPVLLDLGSARRVIAGIQSALTVVVKPGYAPIEQYAEDTLNEQGPWTDIYALGAVLFFAVTGKTPNASVSRMMRDTLQTLTSQDYPNFSDNFLSAINNALKLHPSDRFQSIKEFKISLELNQKGPTPERQSLEYNDSKDTFNDEEITQILSEGEINQFKQQLLKTLSSHPINSVKTAALPLNTGRSEKDQNLLMANFKREDCSTNGFEDVKHLIETKPVNHSNDDRISAVSTVSKHVKKDQTKAAKTDNKPKFYQTFTFGVLLTVAAIGATIYSWIPASYKDLDITSEEATEYQPIQSIDVHAGQKVGIYEDPLQNSNAAAADLQNHLYETAVNFNFDEPSRAYDATIENETIVTEAKHVVPDATYNDKALFEDESSISSRSIVNTKSRTSTPINEGDNQNIVTTTITSTKEQKIAPGEMSRPAVTGFAKLRVRPWGEVWVNNQRQGVSPPLHELSLAPGTYQIEIRNPGQPSEARTIRIVQGENPEIFHDFNYAQNAKSLNGENKYDAYMETETGTDRPIENLGGNPETESKILMKNTVPLERKLSIKVRPWGEIILNGKMVGVTPPLHQLKLSPGTHTIEIRHPNYPSKKIQINEDDIQTTIIEHNF